MINLLKHENCKDVAIRILKKYYIPEKDIYKCKVEWWLVTSDIPRLLVIRDKIEIKR